MSRDTVTWHRLRPRQPFLPRTPGGNAVGAFDCQITDTALSPPIRRSEDSGIGGGMDTLWFYYWGGPAMHGNRHLSFGRGMGLAQLRADGFCSLRASRFPGTLVTKPFVWPGGQLQVNASALGGGGNGNLQTEVLAEDLGPVSGLTRAQADKINGDGTGIVQTWNGNARAMDGVKAQTIRLKFYLDNIDLFSFRASEV